MLSLPSFCKIYFSGEDGPYWTYLKEMIADGRAFAVARLDWDGKWRADAIAFLKTQDTPERRAAVKNEYTSVAP